MQERIVHDKIPPELYGDCGNTEVRKLTAGDKVGDGFKQSKERGADRKACLDAVQAIKKWDTEKSERQK